MVFLKPNLHLMRLAQRRAGASEQGTLTVYRDDQIVGIYSHVRATSARLFAEPADPYDANVRSMAEWGFTVPFQEDPPVDIRVADRVTLTDRANGLRDLDLIVGEVVQGDTWEAAIRFWANAPKTATKPVTIVLHRLNGETWEPLQPQRVQFVYDRVRPESTPLRYAQSGFAAYQGGTFIGDLNFDVQVDDRCVLEDPDVGRFTCFVYEVLPGQPQRREARFYMDVIGN